MSIAQKTAAASLAALALTAGVAQAQTTSDTNSNGNSSGPTPAERSMSLYQNEENARIGESVAPTLISGEGNTGGTVSGEGNTGGTVNSSGSTSGSYGDPVSTGGTTGTYGFTTVKKNYTITTETNTFGGVTETIDYTNGSRIVASSMPVTSNPGKPTIVASDDIYGGPNSTYSANITTLRVGGFDKGNGALTVACGVGRKAAVIVDAYDVQASRSQAKTDSFRRLAAAALPKLCDGTEVNSTAFNALAERLYGLSSKTRVMLADGYNSARTISSGNQNRSLFDTENCGKVDSAGASPSNCAINGGQTNAVGSGATSGSSISEPAANTNDGPVSNTTSPNSTGGTATNIAPQAAANLYNGTMMTIETVQVLANKAWESLKAHRPLKSNETGPAAARAPAPGVPF
ncbi:MAG TPA: hypothetical protein VFR09_04480 [Alphaproteobacteria bacterium]|nr:hypothetical protein [Alphaproteobacteria bacterium]